MSSSIEKYIRAANHLTAAQIFLQDNFMLDRDLTFDDVKPRLLGHWGSGPGVNFVYAHLSSFIKRTGQEMMFVLGPGHAFPSLQANLFMEGTLSERYTDIQQNLNGISTICRTFSWPYGFPSHSNPGTPGVILEGGELGYSLSTSYGAALDNPDLMVACLVGDGEAETGPLAAAWHLNKIVNPRTSGVVLPILHLNGYKISAPTVFGRMSNYELMALFSGYGYQPRIVDVTDPDVDPHTAMQEALDWSHMVVRELRESPDRVSPRLPMIIFRNEKGWSGVKSLNGRKVEGNCLSHQVVLTEAKHNPEQLAMLNEWLHSYRFNELFDPEMGFGDFVHDVLPDYQLRMGATKHAIGGDPVYKPLELPSIEEFSEDASVPGTIGSSSMRRAGLYLNEVFKLNASNENFRLMSPDETYSNKLDKVFESTPRAWMWPIRDWDIDLDQEGRVMEMLSEHNLQGLTQGYVLTGRHAIFASYEAFVQVVVSMMDQYAKFLKHARHTAWRGPVPSLNYILTSSGWRQDHNGFSHQNPGFLDDALRREGEFVNVYFPPDGNSTLAVLERVMSSTKQINIIVAGKTLEPRWLTPEKAREQVNRGIAVWDFASDENPDVVLAGIGDYPTKEVVAAIDIVKQEFPDARLRCVNVSALTSRGFGHNGVCIDHETFEKYFTADKPVILNFHGYPETIKSILFNYTQHPDRFTIRGYIEEGSTTTPFDMHVRNKTSRFHLVMEVARLLAQRGRITRDQENDIFMRYQQKIEDNKEYSKAHGLDLPEIDAWQWGVKTDERKVEA
ncbi:phosphoketolase [Candidatus Saccharibacteria bacterium]|nr:MAG: phosphoketolase [Candidatus Saccharibacteria bacterium]